MIPLLELTYDFISQYEDNEDQVTRETKDFILDSIKFIESSVEEETIDDNFENLNSIFETCKIKSGNEIYMQYSFCLLYTSPSPRDAHESRMPSSA